MATAGWRSWPGPSCAPSTASCRAARRRRCALPPEAAAAGPPRRIVIVSDAWEPQVNGVVRTLQMTAAELRAMGHAVTVVGPDRFRTVPMPSYPEIRLALAPGRRLGRLLDGLAPDALHIATEGPLGFAARAWCRRRGLAFTTSYHTHFPDYVRSRWPVPKALTYAVLRRFHNAGSRVLVATPSLAGELAGRGFARPVLWSRGVDTALFRPRPERLPFPGPVFLYVGRVAVEKNIEAFLALDLPGTKVVVGDGPQRAALEARHPEARFLGALRGEALAAAYAGADVFVFPSRTDTFGLVVLEALASGLPVAAFPVPGPRDIVGSAPVGVLGEDLRAAACAALSLDRAACREFALGFSWRRTAETFLRHAVPCRAAA